MTRALPTLACPHCASPLIGATLAAALHPQPLWCAWDGARVPMEAEPVCEDCDGEEAFECGTCRPVRREAGLTSGAVWLTCWMGAY